MNALPVEDLLASLGDDAPCGADLEYDPAFLALEEAARGKPEQQFGDTVIAAEGPDWRAVSEQALELARRTRDVRVAVHLARASARLKGVTAYASGIALIAGLLERHWDHVYPALDADDNNDPTMRLNALAPLVDTGAGLADLRAASIGGGRPAITVREIELAFGKTEPLADETVPSADGMLQALQAAESQATGTLASLKQLHADVTRIEKLLIDKVGGAQGPELRPLRVLAQALATAAEQAQGGSASEGQPGADGQTAAAGAAPVRGTPGTIVSREDVLKSLDRACEWLEKNEPTNPAPLLIRRAQRLMGKNFLEIIRDLAPAGIDQIENIAGTQNE
ncbi:type VI secretion system protein TssA [Rhizobacter sp. J219]|jgi:type VI secretion system protein ImpA|uniref:type VI secretion system protein TssA n=1 Tax=Rhizobacter sp. J219 TaxID=2898430 RepID=UPI0021511DF8|nr:type VI secretion system protein TssA [Rhizobacter sp. J219]MCR5882455.1 type VI secretion system protein TssA [Rhizobacter sp. J219]